MWVIWAIDAFITMGAMLKITASLPHWLATSTDYHRSEVSEPLESLGCCQLMSLLEILETLTKRCLAQYLCNLYGQNWGISRRKEESISHWMFLFQAVNKQVITVKIASSIKHYIFWFITSKLTASFCCISLFLPHINKLQGSTTKSEANKCLFI